MTAAKKLSHMTIEEFELAYEGTRSQFHEGEVWEAKGPAPDHSDLMGALTEVLRSLFHKKGGPLLPGGWWIQPEVSVKYGLNNLFVHDMAGWKRSKHPERPRLYPIIERPDWVCEILSSNDSNDLVKKKSVLLNNEVPYYWIVHPTDKIITVLEWSSKGYVSILDVTQGFEGKIPPFDVVKLSANLLFGEDNE